MRSWAIFPALTKGQSAKQFDDYLASLSDEICYDYLRPVNMTFKYYLINHAEE